MSQQIGYQCEQCKKTKMVSDGSIPECCGEPMKQVPLEICTKPHDPEHARPMDNEEACDDFRAG
jgi:hypothetical protein